MKKPILLLIGIFLLITYSCLIRCGKEKSTQSSIDQDCNQEPLSCKRGDINYNTIPYEVADVVLLAQYFVEGIEIFSPYSDERDYQICASDVNKDCQSLTLSDLVYLIRIILHDAVEIKNKFPSSDFVCILVRHNEITSFSSGQIAAIRFEFDSTTVPILLATNMEMMNKDNKILVWNRMGNCIVRGDKVISFTGNVRLKKVEAADRDSRELKNLIVLQLN